MESLRPLIAANWKMNHNAAETVEYIEKFLPRVENIHEVDILLCPSYTSLAHAAEHLKGSNVHLGAQNMFYEARGAFTGEIAPKMLKEAGCTYVILGHSERRLYFVETDFVINKKVKKALQSGIIPILCVGETEQEQGEGITEQVISTQLEDSLAGLTAEDIEHIVIAYEPVWAIGTGKTATPQQAQAIHAFIRKKLSLLYGIKVSEKVRILYGGSVNTHNVHELMSQKDINGALVGTASLDPVSFAQIARFFHE